MHLLQKCTIYEIAEFFDRSVSAIRKRIKKYSVEPLKEKRKNGKTRLLNLYDSFDIIETFCEEEDDFFDFSDFWQKKKWDCDHYCECLDIAARKKYSEWPGMPCEDCKEYKKEGNKQW
jgi:transposase